MDVVEDESMKEGMHGPVQSSSTLQSKKKKHGCVLITALDTKRYQSDVTDSRSIPSCMSHHRSVPSGPASVRCIQQSILD